MKILSLATALIMTFTSLTFAREGLLGLFTDETSLDCDLAPALFVQFDLHLLYIKHDRGPDGITAFEFKIEKNDADIIICGATWKPGFIHLGDIESGISVATGGCYGAGESFAPLGFITLFAGADASRPVGELRLQRADAAEPQFAVVSPLPAEACLRIVADPGAQSPGIWVSTCEEGYPVHEIYGLYFHFREGICPYPHAVEPTSWGAIKNMMIE